MTTTKTKPRVTSLAPQFLVDDLARSIAYYQKLGFTFGEPWDGFYAIGRYDLVHVKELASGKDIARPAEFLLDSSGTVRWRMVTENFFVIARPEQVLEAAKSLQ